MFLTEVTAVMDKHRPPIPIKHALMRSALVAAAIVFNPAPTATAAQQQNSVAVGSPANEKMPKTGLTPAKLIPNLCSVHYRISTASPDCQAFFDQGLGYLYSYVWMEASRSFEAAV